MGVNWKYDLLFSLNILYDPGLQPKDFLVRPSASCEARLKKHNLIFKPVENGGMVIAEKRVHPDGTTEPLWKVGELTAFTFFIQLKNKNLFNSIDPYSDDPMAILPDFFGRRRVLYLDNLDAGQNIDQGLVAVPGEPHMRSRELAFAGRVSSLDLASLVPNVFQHRRPGGTLQLRFNPLVPNAGAPIEYTLNDLNPAAEIELEQIGYRLEQFNGSTTSEIVFADTETLSSSLFAVAQIYKDETLDYNTSIRYDIHFEES